MLAPKKHRYHTAPQAQPWQVPGIMDPASAKAAKRGLFGAVSEPEKAKANWADKMGLLGGMLLDLDGGFGKGNARTAQQDLQSMLASRDQQAMAQFEQKRKDALMQAASQGDSRALFMLSPELAISQNNTDRAFDYGKSRDQVQDTRYQDQQDYARGRDALQDERWDKSYDRGVLESDRTFEAQEQARRNANAPRNIWQSAGDGVIFNQATGQHQNVSGGGSGFGGSSQQSQPTMTFGGDFIPAAFSQLGPAQMGGQDGDFYLVDGDQQPAQPQPIDEQRYQFYRSSEQAKQDAKLLEDARQRAISYTTQTAPKIQEMRRLMDQGMEMGPLAGMRENVARTLPFTRGLPGIPDAGELARAGAFRNIAGNMVLEMAEKSKGSMSDSDLAYFKTLTPQVEAGKLTSQGALDAMEKVSERDRQYAATSEAWTNRYGGLSMPDENGQTFFTSWGEWTQMNPLFGEGMPTSGQDIQTISDDAGYDALPSGATFIGPDGRKRRKP